MKIITIIVKGIRIGFFSWRNSEAVNFENAELKRKIRQITERNRPVTLTCVRLIKEKIAALIPKTIDQLEAKEFRFVISRILKLNF